MRRKDDRIDHAHRTGKFYEMLGYQRGLSVDGGDTVRIGMDDADVESMTTMLEEEYAELAAAVNDENIIEVIDALADIIFVAIGALWKLGLDPDKVIAEVCRSNLTKEAGATNRLQKDAIKGPQYEPPRWLDDRLLGSFSGRPARVSYVLTEASRLRTTKGRDYMSGGVTRADLNPFGLESYAHNVIHKMARIKSLVSSGHDPGHESLRDNCVDAINYLSFMVEFLDGNVVDY